MIHFLCLEIVGQGQHDKDTNFNACRILFSLIQTGVRNKAVSLFQMFMFVFYSLCLLSLLLFHVPCLGCCCCFCHS